MSESQPLPQSSANSSRNAFIIFTVMILLALAGLAAFLVLNRDNGEAAVQSDTALIDEVGAVIDPPQPLTDFTFVANSGEPLQLSDLRGKYVLLYFGFTYCPDFCPTTMLTFRQIKARLGERADDFAFVLVSVDPERDTPEVLDAYVRRFDETFIGLQGNEAELERIRADFNLYYEVVPLRDSPREYTVDHLASKFLIDPEGRLIRIYSFTDGAAAMTADLLEEINQ
jgi:protein SCO1